MFTQDFVINEGGRLRGNGPVGELVAGVRADMGLLRPFYNERNVPCVTVNTGRTKQVKVKSKTTGEVYMKTQPIYETVPIKDLKDIGVDSPVFNATSLRKEEWLAVDRRLIPPQRERLRLYNDIAKVETYTLDGMGNIILEHETMSDPGKAYQDIHGLSEGTTDTPLFQLEGIPIPITHSSFRYDLRRLTTSRKSGVPLNIRGVEWATRRVVELVEDVAIGVTAGVVYGGASTQVGGYNRTSAVTGLINFPNRLTKTNLTVPTGSNPEATVADVLSMRESLYGANHYGPYGIYHSTDWDLYLDNDYARLGGDNASITLRQRLLRIGTEEGEGANEGMGRQVKFVRRLDRLTAANSNAFTMVMVSLNPNVIRAVNGMPVTVFQYETKGGWDLHFRVACMMMTEMFADYDGNCGVMHARTA